MSLGRDETVISKLDAVCVCVCVCVFLCLQVRAVVHNCV